MRNTITLYLLSIFLICLNLSAQAQDTNEAKYLFNEKSIRISGFGGVFTEMSFINSGFAVSMGAGGALLIHDRFFIGGYGTGLTTNHFITDFTGYEGKNLRISFGAGGLWLGYINHPMKRVHLSVSIKGGWGSLSLTDDNKETNNEIGNTGDKVFVTTPELECEVNILPWLKFNVGAGYRIVTGFDRAIWESQNFNSPVLTFGLYFGGFQEEEEVPPAEE